MPSFGTSSQEKIATLHPDLQKVLYAAIQHFDFTVIEGVRSKERQNQLVADGLSETFNSKHIAGEDGYAHAVDLAPWPVDWEDKNRFFYLAGLILGISASMGVDITWGHDWDNDGDFEEHKLKDGPHFQLRS